jgi:ubiquinone/menaquinone biosynthesis C-methylase UbiE
MEQLGRPGDSRELSTVTVDEAARYDRIAAFYDLAIVPAQLVIAGRRRGLLRQARGRVLDIGIGTGATLGLYPSGVQVVGVDVSQRMLERAVRRARRRRPSVFLGRASAGRLPFRSGLFDTVVTSLVLCSVPDLPGVLAEIKRVLVPDGQLLLIEHTRPPGRLGRLFDRLDPFWYRQSCHLNRRTVEEVQRAGFDVLGLDHWLAHIFTRLVATPRSRAT